MGRGHGLDVFFFLLKQSFSFFEMSIFFRVTMFMRAFIEGVLKSFGTKGKYQ